MFSSSSSPRSGARERRKSGQNIGKIGLFSDFYEQRSLELKTKTITS